MTRSTEKIAVILSQNATAICETANVNGLVSLTTIKWGIEKFRQACSRIVNEMICAINGTADAKRKSTATESGIMSLAYTLFYHSIESKKAILSSVKELNDMFAKKCDKYIRIVRRWIKNVVALNTANRQHDMRMLYGH